MKWLCMLLALVVLACGGPGEVAAPDVPADADPWLAVDDGDRQWVVFDLQRLRALGWMPLVKGMLDDTEAVSDCDFDVWTDIDRIGMSLNDDDRMIGALTAQVRVEDVTCKAGTALARLTPSEAKGQDDMQREGNVLLFGSAPRFDAGKTRLAGPPSKLPEDTLAAAHNKVGEGAIEQLTLSLRGADDKVVFEVDIVPTKRDDVDAAQIGINMRQRMLTFAEAAKRHGEPAAPLVAALEQPELNLSARGVRLTVTVPTTDALRNLMIDQGANLFDSRGRQCKTLTRLINSYLERIKGARGDMHAIAALLGELGRELEGLSLSDARLSELRDAHVAVMAKLSGAAKLHASAKDAGKATEAEQHLTTMKKHSAEESQIIAAINETCSVAGP